MKTLHMPGTESTSPKYVFITGGVMSGLGKGITAASLGRLLIDRGYDVTAIKIDPYLNVDAGTMSPGEHGEVYVLNDGTEVDLDLGNYERFLDIEMASANNITTGKVYQHVIQKEREGGYLGDTVQIIPHITDEIQDRIKRVANGHDICLIEVGGTVGDIEGMPFLESIRQLKQSLPNSQFALVHVTLIPHSPNNEQKTKPTQHSIKELRGSGVQPDIIVGRCTEPLNAKTKEKIALFADIPKERVISNPDVEDIYQAPLQLYQEGFDTEVLQQLTIDLDQTDTTGSITTNTKNTEPSKSQSVIQESDWHKTVTAPRNKTTNITLLGKYKIEDSYMSVIEAVHHAGMNTNTNVAVTRRTTDDTTNIASMLNETDGLIIPGGFDNRGVETKIQALEYARKNDIPTLGLCLGFQLMVIEYARNVCGLTDAHSTEFDADTSYPVIDIMPEQYDVEGLGGTMRLGEYTADVVPGTKAHEFYGNTVSGRHRHRYELNPEYIDELTKHDTDHTIVFSAETNNRKEIVEIPEHTYYFGTQYHPEYSSRPTNPEPTFTELITKSTVN